MKSDFLLAITQLAAEKNLPREVVLGAVESALESAYRKDSFAPNQNISVKIDPATGRVQVWAEKTVVTKPADPRAGQVEQPQDLQLRLGYRLAGDFLQQLLLHHAADGGDEDVRAAE